MNLCQCLVVIFVNNQLVKYGGDMAVGGYGIANSAATIFVMFVMGVNQGMQPIAGYNYGSRQLDRLMRVLNLSIIAATCIMTTGWVVAEFLPHLVARIFTTDSELTRMAVVATKFNMAVFPIIGFQMVVTNFFQCIGKVKVSIFLSLSRQLLILVPLLGILPCFFGLDGIWYALPASDASAAVIAFFVMTLYMRRFKKELNNTVTQEANGQDNY